VSLGTTSASGISGKRTYDLVAHLRAQRLRWLGHILRLPQTELLHEIVKHVAFNQRRKGDILYAGCGAWPLYPSYAWCVLSGTAMPR
jgi:hypothetical protein